MTDAGDAMPAAAAASSVPADAQACAPAGAPDDRSARRAALRDLAALIGVEVFY